MTPAQKAVVEKAIVDGITLARAGALFFGCAISDPVSRAGRASIL